MGEKVFYWRGSAEVRADVIRALERHGVQVIQLHELEEIIAGTGVCTPVMIIVDASAGQREAAERILQLSSADVLFSFPLLFIGRQAKKRTEALERSFKHFRAVDVPYRAVDVFSFIASSFEKSGMSLSAEAWSGIEDEKKEAEKEEEGTPSSADPALSGKTAEKEEDTGGDQTGFRSRHRAIIEADDTRVILQPYQDPKKMPSGFGGRVFAIARGPEDFNDDVLLPEHPARQEIKAMLDELSARDKWAGINARRVAFVAAAIANALDVGEKRDANIRLVSLFLNLALMESSRNMLRSDLIGQRSHEIFHAVGEGIRQSSKVVSSRFKDEHLAQTLEIAGEILLGDCQSTDSEMMHDAQCALLVELTSRSCWNEGRWNPYGAYRAMRRLRKNEVIAFADANVTAGVLRVLAEAVSAHVTVRNSYAAQLIEDDLGPHVKFDSPEQHREWDRQAKEAGETVKYVDLAELSPGMRLARPIRTMDGRLVIDANTRLDKEMVFLLWQLSAIRAVEKKVAVRVKAESEPVQTSC